MKPLLEELTPKLWSGDHNAIARVIEYCRSLQAANDVLNTRLKLCQVRNVRLVNALTVAVEDLDTLARCDVEYERAIALRDVTAKALEELK